ncbi:DMT family transporter [Desulforamulus aeronauticus]|uniref:EamA domain-containing membrane protein RarD n=1 Tax=Desulforamulus aeronauticus DSM 10349 TaxID=1121421 RepID=A0A1M6UXX4_9FIRM|nr:EamA family transporter [Desulforamulus aeronauticus]SHK73971.1 EamA domain-containing membrane protein RarD [Desulforamulus aeronauticus DSM 10349]
MKKAYFKYILALLLFGFNGVVVSHITLASYEIVFLRTVIGSLLLLAIVLLSREKFTFWQHKRQFLFLAISAIAMGASGLFLYEAYNQIGVGIASLAYYCGPVIVMVLSPLLFRERLTYPKIIGFMVVLCGILFVNGQAFQEGKTAWGLFCGGMSALMYALMIIFNKKAKNITGLENSTLQLTISFLPVAVFCWVKQGLLIQIPGEAWIWVLLLGVLNTGIGCYLYFSSIDSLPVQTVSICGYLEPLTAVVSSAIFLQETMNTLQICGAIMIIGGAIIGECFLNKKAQM